jgi:hypothetical protein
MSESIELDASERVTIASAILTEYIRYSRNAEGDTAYPYWSDKAESLVEPYAKIIGLDLKMVYADYITAMAEMNAE